MTNKQKDNKKGEVGFEGEWDGVLRGRGCPPPKSEMPKRPISLNFLTVEEIHEHQDNIGFDGDREGVLRGRGCPPPKSEMPIRSIRINYTADEIRERQRQTRR